MAGEESRAGPDVTGQAAERAQEREAKLSALRAALIEGELSGASEEFDFEAFIVRKRGQR